MNRDTTANLMFVAALVLAGVAIWGKVPMKVALPLGIGLVVVGSVVKPNQDAAPTA